MDAKKHSWVDYLACLIFGAVIYPMRCFYVSFPCFSIRIAGIVMFILGGVHVICFFGLRLFLKKKEARVFFMSVVAFIFWVHPSIVALFPRSFTSRYSWVFSVVFWIAGTTAFFFAKRCRWIPYANRIIGIFSCLLCVIQCMTALLLVSCDAEGGIASDIDKGIYPNIYHILLDAHPNQKGLSRLGGDLRPFYNELERLGFICYPEAKSTYYYTEGSVKAMWCMDAEVHAQFRMEDAVAFKKLTEVYNCRLMIPWLNGILYARRYVVSSCSGGVFGFLFALFNNRASSLVNSYYFRTRVIEEGRRIVESVFENMKGYKKIYGSLGNFFYGHILSPHAPLLYGDNVFQVPVVGLIKGEENVPMEYASYVCQNCYGIERITLEAIETILDQYSNDPVKPIIILHSDHGLRVLTDEDSMYGNLFAIYMPDEWKKDAKDLKFINLYRFIFNHLFGTNYEYLPDVRRNLDGSIFKEKTLSPSEQ